MSLVRWSHNPAITLLGIGNRIQLQIPLECMRKEDSLIIRRVEYHPSFRELQVDADILRRPFLSPYVDPQRFEPLERDYGMDFFEKNFNTLNNSQAPPSKDPPALLQPAPQLC